MLLCNPLGGDGLLQLITISLILNKYIHYFLVKIINVDCLWRIKPVKIIPGVRNITILKDLSSSSWRKATIFHKQEFINANRLYRLKWKCSERIMSKQRMCRTSKHLVSVWKLLLNSTTRETVVLKLATEN